MKKFLISIFCLIYLSACVVTETGNYNPKEDKGKALETSVQLAKNYIRDSNWEGAIRHLKKALEYDPNSAEVHQAMAMVFQNTGEIELAEQHYQKSIAGTKDASMSQLNYGLFLFNQKRFSDAKEQLQLATNDVLFSERSSAFIYLARTNRMLESIDEAEDAYMRAYRLNPNGNPILILEMADFFYQQKKYDQSKAFFQVFLTKRIAPTPTSLLLGARLAKLAGDKNLVASYGLKLKNLYPNSAQYQQYLKEFGYGN